jgi:enamine deaminase RidA (YjgF/YER057c/UK114 family)
MRSALREFSSEWIDESEIQRGFAMSIDARLAQLGIVLPPAPPAGGVYSPVVIVDRMAYVSGQVPFGPDGKFLTGRVGSDLTLEQGAAAARSTGLTMLATLKASLGSLDRIRRIVKVLGMVNSTPDFPSHPEVMNGFSGLMVEVFGEAGRAARSAVGMGSLPRNVPVEVEAIVELHS